MIQIHCKTINGKIVCWSDNGEWWDKNTSETKVMSGNENAHYNFIDSIIDYNRIITNEIIKQTKM